MQQLILGQAVEAKLRIIARINMEKTFGVEDYD